MKTQFKLFVLSLFVASFTVMGCGDDAAKDGDDASKKEGTEETSENNTESTGDVAADFKNAMIDMSKQMIEVSEEVKSVADAEAAEPKIEAAMNTFASWIDNLTNSIDDMTVKDLMALKDMQSVNDDPEVKEWGEKVEAAMKKLETDYPEASKKLEELAEKHSGKLQTAMMGLMGKAMQMQSMEKGDAAGGDDGAADKAGE